MPSYPTRETKSGTIYDVRFRIYDDSGIEVQKRLCGYPTKKAAQQAYLNFMKTYTPPTFMLNKDHSYEFDELLSYYIRTAEANIKASSLYDLKWIFDKHITPFFSGKKLTEIKKADLTNWQTAIWTSKNPSTNDFYAYNYLSKIRTTFSGFLSWCEETYDIPNLLKNIKKPKRKSIKKEMLIWELDEFIKFQNTVSDIMWQTFFMLLFYSGCRVGEALALSDEDVILDDGVYYINVNKNVIRKGVSNENKYAVSTPKTTGSNRRIALPNVMTNQIKLYKEYKVSNNISDMFFFGGDTPIAATTYQRQFKNFIDKAQLKHIRVHDLRHSHASMLIHLNVPITVISKRLGHSSIDMTLKKYAHCYSDAENIALSAINQAVCAINVP